MTGPVAVDSSALIAIVNREPEAARFLNALHGARAVIGWPTVFEVRLWTLRRSERERSVWLHEWLESGEVQLVPFDGELERLSAEAYQRFGKRHPAALNFGDCMAYAVAAHHDAPLLFKGSDFAKTDLRSHPASAVLP